MHWEKTILKYQIVAKTCLQELLVQIKKLKVEKLKKNFLKICWFNHNIVQPNRNKVKISENVYICTLQNADHNFSHSLGN